MRRHLARHPERAKYRRSNGSAKPGPEQALRPSAELGAVILDTLGLPAAIEWHLNRFRRSTGIPWDLQVHDAAGFDLPEGYAATVFDVYNETLNNIARHSGASRVAIALTITPREITMVVRDNGFGRAAMPAGSAGRSSGIIVTVSLPIGSAN